MNPLIVTAGIIRKNMKILITQRMEGSLYSLKWEFPGGKLETGESPENCLIREIDEELKIKIKVGDIFKVVYHEYSDKTILLLCYMADLLEGEPVAIECNDYRWIVPHEVHEYTFLEADKAIVDKIAAIGNEIFEIDGD